jgi:ComF family protein
MAPPMVESHAPFVHHGPVSRAIHRWKYEDHPELTRSLAQLLVEHAGDFLERAPPCLVAIPLHRQRLWERRYDQAELLARELASLLGASWAGGLMKRQRKTRRQVGLLEDAREANVRDAFVATREGHGENVLLLDDVLTTGATARAACKALRTAGFGEIWLVTLARAHSGF